MDNIKELVIHIPEKLAIEINILLQLQEKNIHELTAELYTDYIKETIKNSVQRNNIIYTDSHKKRIKITSQMIVAAYKVSKEVHGGSLTISEAKDKIHKSTGMKINSAQDYIKNFFAMMGGHVYHRTMSINATDYFLRQIYADYGVDQFKLAVSATQKHIEYYESVSESSSYKKVKLIEKLQGELL